jgi:1,4-dihydroxy-2-naphthoyl-CoA synthase
LQLPGWHLTPERDSIGRRSMRSSPVFHFALESSNMSDRLLIDLIDHVAHVRLNRPEKLNALDYEMFQALNEAPARIRAMDDVRAVVVSGEGTSFCSGLDVQSMMRSPEFFQKAFEKIEYAMVKPKGANGDTQSPDG